MRIEGEWHDAQVVHCDSENDLAVLATDAAGRAGDHIAVVDAAVAQIPAKHRRKMLFTFVIRGSVAAPGPGALLGGVRFR